MNYQLQRSLIYIVLCLIAAIGIVSKSQAQDVEPTTVDSPQIVGGSEVTPKGKYLGMVSIGAKGWDNDLTAHGCGGTLIHPNWVLTAAHCFTEDFPLQVVINRHDLLSSEGEKIDVDFVRKHKSFEWTDSRLTNDLAILRLKRPSKVPTMPLASKIVRREGFWVGWGLTIQGDNDEKSKSRVLREVRVPFVHNDICNAYQEARDQGYPLTEEHICTGYQPATQSACKFDSGGPLVTRSSDGTWMQQMGIASFLTALNTDCDSYNVATNATRYYKWIQDELHKYGDAIHITGDCTANAGKDLTVVFEHPDCRGRYDSVSLGVTTRPFRFEPAAFYVGEGRSILLEDHEGNHLCATRSLWNTRKDFYHPRAGIQVYGNINKYTVYLDNTCGGQDFNKNGILDTYESLTSLPDDARFTGVEFPNDQYVGSPNAQIEKRWQVRNTGTGAWHSGYRLVFVGGHQMGAPTEILLPSVQPNQTTDLKITITIPSGAGMYRGNWRLRNPQGTFFGDPLWVQVTVPGAASPPPSGGPSLELSCSNCPVTVTPGQKIRPTIQVKVNSGQLQGTNLRGDMLRHKSGDRFGAWEFVAVPGRTVVNPGQTHSFTFYEDNPITAPSNPGVYETVWQVWRNGGWDGPEFKIRFEVVASGSSNQRPHRPKPSSPHNWYVYYSGNTATLCAQQMGDPDGDAISGYYFEIYESAQNWNSGWTGNSCVTTGALGPYGYKWRVKVRDSRGLESEWSESWHFTLVNPNLSIKELYFQPQDNNERVKIRACTEGQGGVGITLRTSVNDANDGSGNGTWRIIHELGVPCYNEQDAPIWTTLNYASGPHRVRVEARGSGTGWDGAAVREEVYNIPSNLRPNHPSGQEPRNQASLNSRTVQFKWKETWRTTSYRLEAFDNEQYTGTPLLDVQVPAGTTDYLHTFQGNPSAVFWRVTAYGPHGSHSSTQRFYIDTTPPVSTVQALPAKVTETLFQVTWSGTDQVSGIRWYQIQVKEGTRSDSQWVDWLVNTAETSALFQGKAGETYAFRARAMDNVGNWEGWRAGNGDTRTTVDLSTGAPIADMADLAILSLESYPLTQDSQVVQTVVQNTGSRSTENGFYIDLYANRLPTGPGDYTGSIQFWQNSSIEPGATVTLTAVVTRDSELLAAATSNTTGEKSITLYAQADSSGAVKEASKANNINSDGLSLCFASPDAYEDNDTPAKATTLNLNQPQQHNLATPGDEDWFKFTVSSAGTYVVRTFDLGESADTYLYLYAGDGSTLLTANDDYGDSLASQIEWKVSTPGAYYLRVRQWNPTMSGCGTNYSIEVKEQPTVTPVPPTNTPTPTSTPQSLQIYLPAIGKNAAGGGPVSNPQATVTPTPTSTSTRVSPTATPTPTSTPTATPTSSPTPMKSANWIQLEDTSWTTPRSGYGLAYDTEKERLVIYGGSCPGEACSETYFFTASSGWQKLGIAGPSAREDVVMVYDSGRKKVVLFGGHPWAGIHLADTWEFDGQLWTMITTSTTPPNRSNQAMTYDSNRQRVIMFGGWRNTQMGNDILDDTWEYDGTNWTQIITQQKPPGRAGARMVYVPAWDKTVLFGGLSNDQLPIQDTWIYDGQDWIPLTVKSSPPVRYNHQMALDPVNNQILLFGGIDVINGIDVVAMNDTWRFDGTEWREVLPATTPPPIWAASMVYYAPLEGIVMFGGNSPNQGNLKSWQWLYK